MNIFKAMAVRSVEEATRAIPVIDFGARVPRRARRARRRRRAGPPGLRARRLLLHRRSRRPAGGDRRRLRGLARVPRDAARRQDAAQDQREQHRLPAGEPEHAARLDGPQGHAAQLQRELLHQPRPRAPITRTCVAGKPLRGAQPVAGRPRADARRDAALLQDAGGASASGCCRCSRASLDMPAGYFAPFFANEAHINLRFLHYPPQEIGRRRAVRPGAAHRQLVHHDPRARGRAGAGGAAAQRRVARAAA